MERLQGFQARIKAGETDLETLALTESDCSSAKHHGDLGFFKRGQMQAPFEKVSFALQVDEMSEPVWTDSGVHLILRTG
jgi:NIMA-interacting peptidyl-prolyl cis-trans isomerase 1